MASRHQTFIKNSSYAILSNLLNLIVSSSVVLILPRFIGVTSYGYWQLYLFYVSYVGFFHLGWIDGIYLKYGGAHYSELNKVTFYSQFVSYALFQSIVAILIFGGARLMVVDTERAFIFYMLALSLLLTNLRFFTIYLLQTTNSIRESSAISIFDRGVYVFLLLGLLVIGQHHYHVMVYADVVARLLSLLYGIYLCREVLLQPLRVFQVDLEETFDNIRIGSSLMLSNVASLLIIGVIRLGIERQWDIATFGRISLTLSISNLMMVFINAIGVVIFPLLRRLPQETLPNLYKALRNLLMPLMLFVLMLYFPLKFILLRWLPDYELSIHYMTLVFPMAIYEGKMALLVNTYLKALRMEKYILRVNLITVVCSLLLTVMTTMLLKQLELAVMSIVLLLAFRSVLAEYFVSKQLQLTLFKDNAVEILLTLSFIALGWYTTTTVAFICYGLAYLIYLGLKKRELFASLTVLKELIN